MSENALKIENEKLKEVSDIARNQIQLFETRKRVENKELESLRSQLLELQATSDERAQAGRLHRQIVSMQGRRRRFTFYFTHTFTQTIFKFSVEYK